MSNSNTTGNILQILAGLPEFLRKSMVKNRLIEFLTFSEIEKKEIIINTLKTAPEIDFSVLSKLVKTWMEVLCELDEEQRKAMFGAYVDVLVMSPEILVKLNIEGLIAVFELLPDNMRELLGKSLKEYIDNLSNDKKINFIEAIPGTAKKVLMIS